MPSEPSSRQRETANRPLVYVVDDEHTIATTLALILRMQGLNAASFTLPREALRAAWHTPPHLLLSDVFMPDMTGTELATALLAICPECKVLFISGNAGTFHLIEKEFGPGHPYAILEKPIHPQKIIAEVNRLLDGPISPPE